MPDICRARGRIEGPCWLTSAFAPQLFSHPTWMLQRLQNDHCGVPLLAQETGEFGLRAFQAPSGSDVRLIAGTDTG